MTSAAKPKPRRSIMAMSPERACERGFEFEVVDPFAEKGEPSTGMFITVLGTEARAVKVFLRAKGNEELLASASGEKKAARIEEWEATAVERAVATVVSWRGIVMDEGQEELPFTPENAAMLFEQAWIRKQVLDASEDLGNFKPG